MQQKRVQSDVKNYGLLPHNVKISERYGKTKPTPNVLLEKSPKFISEQKWRLREKCPSEKCSKCKTQAVCSSTNISMKKWTALEELAPSGYPVGRKIT